MLSTADIEGARDYAKTALAAAGIYITEREQAHIEVSDFGLGQLLRTGLQLVVYIDTERVCAKEIALRPGQTCPEHRHPGSGDEPGKEETFRVRAGTVFLYVEGDPTPNPRAMPPRPEHYTAWHEIVLRPGQQYTISPGTLHWFQAGVDGAIVSEFSTRSTDDLDSFTDPEILRLTVIAD